MGEVTPFPPTPARINWRFVQRSKVIPVLRTGTMKSEISSSLLLVRKFSYYVPEDNVSARMLGFQAAKTLKTPPIEVSNAAGNKPVLQQTWELIICSHLQLL